MIDTGLAALCISGAVFALQLFDRIWLGGSRTAAAETAMKEYVDAEVAELRKDVFLKHDTSEGNVGTALQSLKDLAHKAELEAMSFRAFCAENYLRHGALNDLKTDVKDAFDKIDKRLERMEQNQKANRD